ncbi:Host attachment protein [Stanieria cyanosphaera PCC 7437]|uniref:Host attachment protein n=1 Tax=Stanieria cyanosphaera (strain ATCC 29371 / PCC 7437) TaxID=111780 RepID=K9XWA5_STAC7|nr:host attachment protein [Stanieria cyanosphaera]AFZ36818.1 Host attachment protein [Stanieria cyanosphaera PCC 7437]
MSNFIIAVINGTQARFFTLEPAEWPDYESGPNLIENEGLLSEANQLHGQELWANVKTGRNRGSSGQAHSYDDHRDNHAVEFEKRFAQNIINKITQLTQTHQAQQLILVAEPQILGLIRNTVATKLPKQLKQQDLAKDLCHLNSNQIHSYLAKKELLPACHKGSYT